MRAKVIKMQRFEQFIMPPWVLYIGRIFILIGMVLVFMSLGAFISHFLCMQFFGINITQINLGTLSAEDGNTIAALKLTQTMSGGIGMFLIPALLFPKVIHFKVNQLIVYQITPQFWQILAAILLVFISVPAISFLYNLNQHLSFPAAWSAFEAQIRQMEDQAGAITKIFVAANNYPTLFLNLFVVAMVPAICEEFFFRGIILNYTRFTFKNEWLAIVISALVFSGFHGQFYGFLPRFAMGIVLGYLYLRTGNIYVPIIAHFVNNAMAVLMAYYAKDLSVFRFFDDAYQFDWYWVILSVILTVALLIGVGRYFKYLIYKK